VKGVKSRGKRRIPMGFPGFPMYSQDFQLSRENRIFGIRNPLIILEIHWESRESKLGLIFL